MRPYGFDVGCRNAGRIDRPLDDPIVAIGAIGPPIVPAVRKLGRRSVVTRVGGLRVTFERVVVRSTSGHDAILLAAVVHKTGRGSRRLDIKPVHVERAGLSRDVVVLVGGSVRVKVSGNKIALTRSRDGVARTIRGRQLICELVVAHLALDVYRERREVDERLKELDGRAADLDGGRLLGDGPRDSPRCAGSLALDARPDVAGRQGERGGMGARVLGRGLARHGERHGIVVGHTRLLGAVVYETIDGGRHCDLLGRGVLHDAELGELHAGVVALALEHRHRVADLGVVEPGRNVVVGALDQLLVAVHDDDGRGDGAASVGLLNDGLRRRKLLRTDLEVVSRGRLVEVLARDGGGNDVVTRIGRDAVDRGSVGLRVGVVRRIVLGRHQLAVEPDGEDRQLGRVAIRPVSEGDGDLGRGFRDGPGNLDRAVALVERRALRELLGPLVALPERERRGVVAGIGGGAVRDGVALAGLHARLRLAVVDKVARGTGQRYLRDALHDSEGLRERALVVAFEGDHDGGGAGLDVARVGHVVVLVLDELDVIALVIGALVVRHGDRRGDGLARVDLVGDVAHGEALVVGLVDGEVHRLLTAVVAPAGERGLGDADVGVVLVGDGVVGALLERGLTIHGIRHHAVRSDLRAGVGLRRYGLDVCIRKVARGDGDHAGITARHVVILVVLRALGDSDDDAVPAHGPVDRGARRCPLLLVGHLVVVAVHKLVVPNEAFDIDRPLRGREAVDGLRIAAIYDNGLLRDGPGNLHGVVGFGGHAIGPDVAIGERGDGGVVAGAGGLDDAAQGIALAGLHARLRLAVVDKVILRQRRRDLSLRHDVELGDLGTGVVALAGDGGSAGAYSGVRVVCHGVVGALGERLVAVLHGDGRLDRAASVGLVGDVVDREAGGLRRDGPVVHEVTACRIVRVAARLGPLVVVGVLEGCGHGVAARVGGLAGPDDAVARIRRGGLDGRLLVAVIVEAFGDRRPRDASLLDGERRGGNALVVALECGDGGGRPGVHIVVERKVVGFGRDYLVVSFAALGLEEAV